VSVWLVEQVLTGLLLSVFAVSLLYILGAPRLLVAVVAVAVALASVRRGVVEQRQREDMRCLFGEEPPPQNEAP
jgi:hypothetical protein